MTRINVEEIEYHIAVLRAFNGLALSDVEFYEDGRKIDIPPRAIDDFRFTGLVNRDFIDMRFWEDDEFAAEAQ